MCANAQGLGEFCVSAGSLMCTKFGRPCLFSLFIDSLFFLLRFKRLKLREWNILKSEQILMEVKSTMGEKCQSIDLVCLLDSYGSILFMFF